MSSKSGGKVYYSFDEIGQELFGLKPQRRVTKDKQKLESQKEKFLGTCPFCKQPLKYVYGTNVLAIQKAKIMLRIDHFTRSCLKRGLQSVQLFLMKRMDDKNETKTK